MRAGREANSRFHDHPGVRAGQPRGPGLAVAQQAVGVRLGEGVCGAAVRDKRTLVVPDVDRFPGHIACDSASRSEVVVPVMRNLDVIGVLDLDSPTPGRFDAQDAVGLETLAATFVQSTDLGGG